MIAQNMYVLNSTLSSTNNEHCTQFEYKLLPIERECLSDAYFLKKFNRNVRFEIARMEDCPQIHRFLLNEFGEQEPLNKNLGITTEDLFEPLNRIIHETIPQQMVILIVDQGHLCGVVINSICHVNRDLIKEPKIKEDYGKELDTETTGVSPRLRRIYTILDEIQCFTPKFLPTDCLQYTSVNIISIRPQYAGCGLGKALLIESFKLAHKNGIKFCESTCTALASYKICQSLGMKSVFEFPYSQYKYHGKLVFEEKMHDGCTSVQLMIGNLDEILKNI